MLKTLSIENIAVIEKADVDFSDGLNVLTGETGAGKSIVVDAINAILGERTSKELVRHGAEYGAVSALFDSVNPFVKSKIEELGFNVDDNSVLISRRISSNGKTSCKVNGSPSTVALLKEIGTMLVNIHGQHDSQALLDADKHFTFIDKMSDDKDIFARYSLTFSDFIKVRRQLKNLTVDEDTKERQLELLDYQISELENADIIIGERESLMQRKNIIANAQSIRDALTQTLMAINGDDDIDGISTVLGDSYAKLAPLDGTSDIKDHIEALTDELDTVKELIETKIESLDVEPGELDAIEARLDLLYRLSLKYGNTEEEMSAFLDEAREKRKSILFCDEKIEELTARYDELLALAVERADALSNHRHDTAKRFEKQVCDELSYLDMPNIKFIVDFEKSKLSSTGYDKIEFLISTNPGEPPKPLSKIASGGELSRIMLAIKNIIANNDTVDTLIFDEIDTGVSGRASRKIGMKLKSVAENTQVICVTHSAQIASAANVHFLIEKDVRDGRTYTKVSSLDFESRKREIARIMGGLEITDTLLSSAEELLNEANYNN